jgi:hypothetical protein
MKMGKGRIDKKQFKQAVLNMQTNPTDLAVQAEYTKQVQFLALKLVQWYKIDWQDQEDAVQDMMLMVFHRDLHNKVDPEMGDVLAFYWQSIKRAIWKKQNKQWNRTIKRIPMQGVYESSFVDNVLLSDNGKGEEEMLKDLGFRLDDFTLDEVIDISRIPAVETSAPQRGRPKAPHWEVLFGDLKREQQLTQSELVKLLPKAKRESLKNPSTNVKQYMKDIAKREGLSLTISDDGKDPLYILTE